MEPADANSKFDVVTINRAIRIDRQAVYHSRASRKDTLAKRRQS
jgi:hypothetical protein